MKRVALISGVNRYADTSIRDLRYAVEDTRKVANLLEQAGFVTRYLYDASQARHLEELERICQGGGPGDLLLFYFCGHGVMVNGRHLLLCQDARDNVLQFGRGGLWLEEIKSLSSHGGMDRVFVLDTCREALLKRRSVVNTMEGTASLRDLAAVPPSKDHSKGSLTILCACDEGDTSQEDDALGMGLFSSAFSSSISEALTRSEHLCLDGNFIQRLHQQMAATARQHHLSVRQRPWIQSTGTFPVLLTQDQKPQAVHRSVPVSVSKSMIDPLDQQKKRYRQALIEAGEDGEITHQEWQDLLVLRDELRLKPAIYQEIEKALWSGTTLDEICKGYAKPEKPRPSISQPAPKAKPKVQDRISLNCGGIKLEMKRISAGEFMMGSKESEDEQPIHKVTITRPFYMGIYPVTQAQYQAVMQMNPSKCKGNDCPVESVSWGDAVSFCVALSCISGRQICLPSEAQWEYACRAGSSARYSFGDSDRLGLYAWYKDNSESVTHPVGEKKPNAFGLYDMHGNVWEICQDYWHENYKGAPSDGREWTRGGDIFRCVVRGGSCYHSLWHCRTANRHGGLKRDAALVFGFRVVCIPEE